MTNEENFFNSLISFDDFKALMGVDDRNDKTARFCLVTSTLTIEQYCKRKFLRKQYFEVFKWSGHLVLILKEYPEFMALFFTIFFWIAIKKTNNKNFNYR